MSSVVWFVNNYKAKMSQAWLNLNVTFCPRTGRIISEQFKLNEKSFLLYEFLFIFFNFSFPFALVRSCESVFTIHNLIIHF